MRKACDSAHIYDPIVKSYNALKEKYADNLMSSQGICTGTSKPIAKGKAKAKAKGLALAPVAKTELHQDQEEAEPVG